MSGLSDGKTTQQVRRSLAGRIAPALRRESEWQGSLIEQASDGIFVADLEGRYVYVNSAGCRLLGYARDEILGKTIFDFLLPEEQPLLEASKRDMARGEIHVADWHLRRKDGSYAEVEVSAKIFPDGRWQGFVRDVSERKRLERALQKSIDELNRAQAVAKVGSWRLDVRRNELEWSAEAYRIFGVPYGKPMGYEGFLACVHPDDRAFVEAHWAAALHGEPYAIEHRIVVGGETRWVYEVAELQRDGAGNAVSGIGTVQDITARKCVEQELARAHEDTRRLHAELEQVTFASLAISDAVAKSASAEMASVLQTIVLQAQALTHAQYVALGIGGSEDRPFDSWVYAGMSAATAEAIGRHPRPVGTLGAVAREGERIREKDMRTHPAFRGFPRHHPGMTSFLGIPILYRGAAVGNLYLANKEGATEFTDQDERIIKMLAARVGVAIETATLYRNESMRRLWLQTVIDQMPEGVILFDEKGRVGSVNAAMTRLSCGRVVGHDVYGNPIEFDVRRPDGTPFAPDENHAVRALRGEVTRAAEAMLCLKDGSAVPVLLNAAPVRNENEKIVGATVVVQDIARLKELERLREEWASIIAHDLRQPVAAIAIAADLLEKTHEGALPEREARVVERVKDAAQRLTRMIDELFDASKVETQRLAVHPRTEDLVVLLHDIVEQQRSAAPEKEITIDAPDALWARVDADRIRQVVDNLVSNAIKYGDAGSPVHIRVAGGDEEAEVVVINRGPGIAADEMPILFERFSRSRKERKGSIPGLGLGLYIARALVTAHGGRIWAESTPGETTSFHFTVPRERAAGHEQPLAAQPHL